MKKILLTLVAILSTTVFFAQDKGEFNLTANFANRTIGGAFYINSFGTSYSVNGTLAAGTHGRHDWPGTAPYSARPLADC